VGEKCGYFGKAAAAMVRDFLAIPTPGPGKRREVGSGREKYPDLPCEYATEAAA
jgi:hypothetical protein